LTFRFQVQVPTAVTELTLSCTGYLIFYKLSDDGVSKLRFVVTVRPATEKVGLSNGVLIAQIHCPELLKI